MWSSINQAWKTAFELGWEAFSKGNIPIGAVITDEDGNIISSGRNRIFEKSIYNHKIAHAETEALFKLDISKYPNVHSYTLYACMEPCPMCFGAFVMSNLRTLRVAARDGYCGSVHYRDKDPYVASKNIQADFELGSLEIVQLVMHTYFELKRHDGRMNVVTEIFERDNPVATQIAKSLYVENRLDWHVASKTAFSHVYDEIVMYTKQPNGKTEAWGIIG